MFSELVVTFNDFPIQQICQDKIVNLNGLSHNSRTQKEFHNIKYSIQLWNL
jgi:hypothetical protein